VQRDLLVLGYHVADMFTRLSASEVLSVIMAAPPGSAVRHAFDGGWTTTDHLLATMSEQQDGLVRVKDRYPRPGVTVGERPKPIRVNDDPSKVTFDTMPLDEYLRRQAKR
jgi:hypothetical protein